VLNTLSIVIFLIVRVSLKRAPAIHQYPTDAALLIHHFHTVEEFLSTPVRKQHVHRIFWKCRRQLQPQKRKQTKRKVSSYPSPTGSTVQSSETPFLWNDSLFWPLLSPLLAYFRNRCTLRDSKSRGGCPNVL